MYYYRQNLIFSDAIVLLITSLTHGHNKNHNFILILFNNMQKTLERHYICTIETTQMNAANNSVAQKQHLPSYYTK